MWVEVRSGIGVPSYHKQPIGRSDLRIATFTRNFRLDYPLDYLKDISIIVAQLPEVRVIERDPKDDTIIACAIAVSANYIVSRDRDLLDLGSYKNIQIVPPEEFIHILRIEREHIENQNR